MDTCVYSGIPTRSVRDIPPTTYYHPSSWTWEVLPQRVLPLPSIEISFPFNPHDVLELIPLLSRDIRH